MPLDLDRLYKSWVSASGGFGSREMWDASVSDYASMAIPGNDEPFIAMMCEEVGDFSGLRVLDIGCGSGVYGIALAPYAAEVVCCDLSPKMIEAARAKAIEAGVSNTRFMVGDFRSMEFDGTFDVVFAHTTPAICDAETFEKMESLSRDWVFVAKPVRRTDHLLRELRELCGIPDNADERNQDFLKMLAAIWLKGETPSMRHYPVVWHSERPIDVAKSLYANQLVASDLDDERKRVVIERLMEVACDGVVHERIDAEVAMLGWRKVIGR